MFMLHNFFICGFSFLIFMSFWPIFTICKYFQNKSLGAQRLVDGIYKDVAIILFVSNFLSIFYQDLN